MEGNPLPKHGAEENKLDAESDSRKAGGFPLSCQSQPDKPQKDECNKGKPKELQGCKPQKAAVLLGMHPEYKERLAL